MIEQQQQGPPVEAPPHTTTATDADATLPEDRVAYRIAVGMVGVGLVAFLIGAAVIAAGGKPIPSQYWSTGSAISGALLGILAPTPSRKPAPQQKVNPSATDRITHALAVVALPIKELWDNRGMLILLVVFGTSLGFAIANNDSQLEAVAAAAGGALVGLLAPPPQKQSAG